MGTCLQYQGFRQSYIERLPIFGRETSTAEAATNSLLSPFRWQLVSRHVQRRFDHLGTCLQYQGFRQSYIERVPILDGDFNGGGSNQILFYHPSDNAWWLGTFNSEAITGICLQYQGFRQSYIEQWLFWTGDFNGGGSDQILFYHPSDSHWFLGTFNGGSINWGFSSDTTGFGNLYRVVAYSGRETSTAEAATKFSSTTLRWRLVARHV